MSYVAIIAGCCLVFAPTSNRSQSEAFAAVVVQRTGGIIALPSLGYARSAIFMPRLPFEIRIKATTTDFPATKRPMRTESGKCLDSPQSEVLTFNRNLRLNAIPAIAIWNAGRSGTSRWEYILKDETLGRVIAASGTKTVSKNSAGLVEVHFPSEPVAWGIQAFHRYVFIFQSSDYPPFECNKQY